MRFKKFRAPSGQELMVSSTLGHMVMLNSSFTEIPEVLWKEAYSVGAISEDMKNNDDEAEWLNSKKEELKNKEQKEKEEMMLVLREIYADPGHKISKFGLPKIPEVTAMLGWKPEQSQVQELWEQITKETVG